MALRDATSNPLVTTAEPEGARELRLQAAMARTGGVANTNGHNPTVGDKQLEEGRAME